MAEENKPENQSPDEKIIEDCRKELKVVIDEEDPERKKMFDDLKFSTLDQWPAEIRNERENDIENGPRPCLTIDKSNQFIVQVLNDMRQGKPGINIRPMDDAADIETAKILKGIIRNIEDQSKADIAYATAAESQVRIGLGYIRVTTEYVSEDSFDQEIRIKSVPNTFAVYLGRHLLPDGSDAKRGWIVEAMPVEKFKEEYPGKKYKVDDFSGLTTDSISYWRAEETITVVEYFYIERTRVTLYFLADGTTISEEQYNKWPPEAGAKPSVQDQRTTFKEQLKWCKMTGVEVLEKRDLPGKYIPIIEVVGREAFVGGKRILWGLVRPAKDSLRMYNYFASTITEKMGLAPKSPFIVAEGQLEGHDMKWKQANRKNYAYLTYKAIDVNGNAIPAPQRVGPAPIEAALLQQMQVIEHDVQTSLGMFKAATGESESQQSGRAILALQRESDTGTYHFGANLGVAIRQVGVVVLDMIPHYYDTKRIVRILGEDGEVKTAQIDPNQQQAYVKQGIEEIYNPGVGKYDVSISVGPSYNTKRMEDQAMYVEMAKGAADPASAAVMRYLVVRNSDNPGSQEAAKLFKALLPPPALQALATNEPIPPKAQAILAEMQQKMQVMQEEGQKLQEENMQLKAGAQVEAMKVHAKSEADKDALALKAAATHEEHAQAIDAALREDARLRWEAKLKAETSIVVANINSEATLGTASIKAETDAASALSDALVGHHTEIAKAGIASETAQKTEGMKAEKASGPGKPLEKIAALHAEGQKMHAESMNKLTKVLEQLAKPKTVTAQSSSGATLTAKVH